MSRFVHSSRKWWPQAPLAACIAAAVAGCVLATGRGDVAPGATGTVTVAQGREFMITRDANPGTGYRWQLAAPPDERVVTLVRSEFTPGAPDRAGAPGVQVWTFRAVAPGETTLVFEYVRPWETGVPPARRDEVTVRVEQR